MTNWTDHQFNSLSDGKHNWENPEAPFPGYIANAEHPFTICNALGYEVNGVLSNEWSGTDGPKDFENNLISAPLDWKYRTKKVFYNVNSSKYRTHEWKDINWKDSIVLLGCSNTFGIGLAEDETYAYLLEKITGRQVVNLGFPSGSPDIMLNNASAVIEKFGSPYAVIVNWPPLDRMRYYTNKQYHELGVWTSEQDIADNVNLFSLWSTMFFNETNLLSRSYYISQAIRSMFLGRSRYFSFSYFEYSAHYTRSDAFFALNPTARDMLHPGFENSLEVAHHIYFKILK